MDTRKPIENASLPLVLSAAFNEDASCFSVGLIDGFRIFHSRTCTTKTSRELGGGLGLVQMMGKANYLALAGGGRQPKFAQTKVVIWDDAKRKIAFEITTLTAVRGVQLSKDRVIVILQNSVRVYAFAKPTQFIQSFETVDNVLGLCSMSSRHIAYPGRTTGQIHLADLATLNVNIIPAHSAPLRAIRISPDGEMVATASEKGTLIRVFSTTTAARLFEFRRGVDNATIFSLAFSPSGLLLACTSDKSTLHIFDVPHPKKPPRKPSTPKPLSTGAGSSGGNGGDGRGKWGILGKIPLMPRVFSDVYSFASAAYEAGDDAVSLGMPSSESTTLGMSRPPKGLIGWESEDALVLIGAGQDARWERFVLMQTEDGRRVLSREAWKRYLGDD